MLQLILNIAYLFTLHHFEAFVPTDYCEKTKPKCHIEHTIVKSSVECSFVECHCNSYCYFMQKKEKKIYKRLHLAIKT